MSKQLIKNSAGSPELSFVLLEYFSVDETQSAIASIKESALNYTYEIIVVSNSCYDRNKQQQLRKELPDVKWIFNPVNGGFAYGMNRGLELAEGRFLSIMNSDVRILSGLSNMIEYAASSKEIGAIGPQTLNPEGEIQDSFRRFVTPVSLLKRNLLRIFAGIHGPEKGSKPAEVQITGWLSGAYIMVTRDAFRSAGKLDERYFLYAEDMDWCYRIKQAGYEVVYFPPMKIVFKGSRRARKISKYTWYFIKSHILFWNKFGYFDLN